MDLRATAREIFLEALQAVNLRKTMRSRLHLAGSVLSIDGSAYELAAFRQVVLIAAGKAALPMAEELLAVVSPALSRPEDLKGIEIGTTLRQYPDPRLRYHLGSHPFPDHASATAAAETLVLLREATPETLVFFLLSGGASSMLEAPLDPAMSAEDVTAFHRALVHSGLPITAMNTLRKHFSAVKGGRLALAASAATQCTLLVSDVPPSQPEVIGSGPSMPDISTLADCRQLLATELAATAIPASVRSFFASPSTPETPKPNHPAFARASYHLLLSSNDLARAALASAEAHGFLAIVDQTPDEWRFQDAASYLLQRIEALTETHPSKPVCLISTGELAVPITTNTPGTGGRNQHFALYCALEMASDQVTVLSAGSDGADGNSPAAGAVVDATTLARASHLGLNAAEALARFDSYPLLHALSDTIVTGPTSNNLRDLRLLLLNPRQSPKS